MSKKRDYLGNPEAKDRLFKFLKLDQPLRPLSKVLQDKLRSIGLDEAANMDPEEAKRFIDNKLIEKGDGLVVLSEATLIETIEIYENVKASDE